MDAIIRHKPNEQILNEMLGEEVETETVVFLNDNGEPVEEKEATQVRIILEGKTKRHEIYGFLKGP
jgi:hypothetical protein